MTGHPVEQSAQGSAPVQTTHGSTEPDRFERVRRQWTPPAETALGRARRTANFDPLIQAWISATAGRPALTVAERDLLTAIRLSVHRGVDLLIRLPGGVHRIPLLAAVMIAADTLDSSQADLSDLSGMHPPPGPVALVTTRLVRRAELDRLDASSVPVAPALHPHRLRGDGLASPVRGGRPRLVTGAARLLFVSPATGFPAVAGVPPRAIVIDAASEPDCEWLATARGWAAAQGSPTITVVDLHEKSIGNAAPVSDERATQAILPDPQPTADGENTWIADWPWLQATSDGMSTESLALSSDMQNQTAAGMRGRARLLAVEDASQTGLGEVRERLERLRDARGRPAPWPVCRAARLARLLTELPTRTADYDRIAPRYGGRTLRRLLDDVLDADGRNDFPASWRARVAADWGAVRAGLSTVYNALSDHNPITEVVADLAEDAVRRGQRLDIVCGSRTARDALTGRLVSSGSVSIEDAPLVTLRSINTVEAAGLHRSTLLIGTPAVRWRGRLAAADFGELTVLGRRGDEVRLYQALSKAFGAPSRREARDTRCATLAALTSVAADEDELDGRDIDVGVTVQAIVQGQNAPARMPSQNALVAAAMTEPQDDIDLGLADLESEDVSVAADHDSPQQSQRVLAIPVVVQSTAREERIQPATVFLLAMSARVQRLRDDDVRLHAVTDLAPGMTLIGVSEPERQTLFDRVRPLIAEQRPPVVGLLLQLWRVALDDAIAISGSVVDLTGRLNALGADITSSAVAQWGDARRIGPIDPQNVARIGRIAGSAVVAGEAARIAAVMRAVRIHHSTVGAALAKLAGWHATGDTAALDRAAETLGSEIADLAAELTAWRVIAVGEAVFAPASGLRRPWSIDEVSRMCQPAGDRVDPAASAPDVNPSVTDLRPGR